MPFGLTNASATFQSLMHKKVFKDSLRKFVQVFFDDILVYSPFLEEHQHHLDQVLQTLESHHLFANAKKSYFGQSNLEYLVHIISSQGVAADEIKIQVMLNLPTPRSLKELCGFLGLTGYYLHFVANYGNIAWPLTELLKKYNFHWGNQENITVQALKTTMTRIQV